MKDVIGPYLLYHVPRRGRIAEITLEEFQIAPDMLDILGPAAPSYYTVEINFLSLKAEIRKMAAGETGYPRDENTHHVPL
jgi:hypothetical protein